MPRSSDVRQLVAQLVKAQPPGSPALTPTQVRRIIGRGSMSTICDELRRHAKPAESAPAAAVAQDVLRRLPVARDAARDNAASTELKAQLQTMEAELARAIERFDGMQKRMLMSLDEARQAARYWQTIAQENRQAASTELDAYRQAMYREMGTAGELRGRVQELERQLQEARSRTSEPQRTNNSRG